MRWIIIIGLCLLLISGCTTEQKKAIRNKIFITCDNITDNCLHSKCISEETEGGSYEYRLLHSQIYTNCLLENQRSTKWGSQKIKKKD